MRKNESKFFSFTAPKAGNYLIDVSITIMFMREASGIGLPVFIYKIQACKEADCKKDEWPNIKTMYWQYNGFARRATKTTVDPASRGTLKSTDVISLEKGEKIRFGLECKFLLVDAVQIYLVPPTNFVICSFH